jgi:LmbE family N-acetylglucosaminyl deacetylase
MQFKKDSRVLVVAAHPDDEVLGCGGTLAKALHAGAQVAVLFLGEGISARFPFGQYDSPEFKQQSDLRMQGARRALKSLGITQVKFGERLCCQFDRIPIITLAKEIEEQISTFKPNILLTHNPSEVNVDHRIVYEAVEIACRPTRPETPREIYSFEIVCSGNWTFESTFKPNVFVDVSQFWEAKMAAWRCYEGEDRKFPFPRSDEGLKTLAQYRGMAAGLEKAEAFRLARKIS